MVVTRLLRSHVTGWPISYLFLFSYFIYLDILTSFFDLTACFSERKKKKKKEKKEREREREKRGWFVKTAQQVFFKFTPWRYLEGHHIPPAELTACLFKINWCSMLYCVLGFKKKKKMPRDPKLRNSAQSMGSDFDKRSLNELSISDSSRKSTPRVLGTGEENMIRSCFFKRFKVVLI